jgi:hypothetical protein
MWTIFWCGDGGADFEWLEMLSAIFRVARPKIASGSHLVIRRDFCATTGFAARLGRIQIDFLCKYAFSHSTLQNFYTFLSRTPFLVAYIMRTFFTLMAAQMFECRDAREIFGGVRVPKCLWQSLSN